MTKEYQLSADRKNSLIKFCKRVDIKFKNINLLELAFHHRSITNEFKHILNNERLEFLGDSIVKSCSSEYLYKRKKSNLRS